MEVINGECQNCSLIHKNHCVDTCPTGYEATNGNRKCQECALIHNKQCVQECPNDTERNGKVCVDKSPSVVVLPVCGENMTIRKGKCACMLQMNDECVEKCPVGWAANDNYQVFKVTTRFLKLAEFKLQHFTQISNQNYNAFLGCTHVNGCQGAKNPGWPGLSYCPLKMLRGVDILFLCLLNHSN